MKMRIKKLLYSSLATLISIGINFNTEARVTKEVAEAVLPYLMSAAGIHEDARPNPDPTPNVPYYSKAKRDAIISMIYTDEGQQQMVDWAKKGIFPLALLDVKFTTDNFYLDGWLRIPLENTIGKAGIITKTNKIFESPIILFAAQEIRNAYIGALFPCGPKTFSSFAAHPSRLGYHALDNGGANLENICSAFINVALQVQNNQGVQDIIDRLRQYRNIDNQLASILFVLDICDTVTQIKNILNLTLNADANRDGNIDAMIENAILVNEYSYRPVSATTFPGTRQGDCAETLYRHLVNIAVQNDINAPKNFNVGHLPASLLQGYYNALYGVNDVITTSRTHGEAGKMSLTDHVAWRNSFRLVPGIGNITNTNIADIARVLNALRNALQGNSNLGQRVPISEPLIHFLPQVVVNQTPESTQIQQALNELDGRSDISPNESRFLVGVKNQPDQQDFQNLNLPHLNWITDLIEIVDRLWNRRIFVGASNVQAEIIGIQ